MRLALAAGFAGALAVAGGALRPPAADAMTLAQLVSYCTSLTPLSMPPQDRQTCAQVMAQAQAQQQIQQAQQLAAQRALILKQQQYQAFLASPAGQALIKQQQEAEAAKSAFEKQALAYIQPDLQRAAHGLPPVNSTLALANLGPQQMGIAGSLTGSGKVAPGSALPGANANAMLNAGQAARDLGGLNNYQYQLAVQNSNTTSQTRVDAAAAQGRALAICQQLKSVLPASQVQGC
jgi:hypothetical protein